MIRRPPSSTLFPYPPFFRSPTRITGASSQSKAFSITIDDISLPNPPIVHASCATTNRLVLRTEFRINSSSSGRKTNRLVRSEEHTSELQSHLNLVCRLLL